MLKKKFIKYTTKIQNYGKFMIGGNHYDNSKDNIIMIGGNHYDYCKENMIKNIINEAHKFIINKFIVITKTTGIYDSYHILGVKVEILDDNENGMKKKLMKLIISQLVKNVYTVDSFLKTISEYPYVINDGDLRKKFLTLLDIIFKNLLSYLENYLNDEPYNTSKIETTIYSIKKQFIILKYFKLLGFHDDKIDNKINFLLLNDLIENRIKNIKDVEINITDIYSYLITHYEDSVYKMYLDTSIKIGSFGTNFKCNDEKCEKFIKKSCRLIDRLTTNCTENNVYFLGDSMYKLKLFYELYSFNSNSIKVNLPVILFSGNIFSTELSSTTPESFSKINTYIREKRTIFSISDCDDERIDKEYCTNILNNINNFYNKNKEFITNIFTNIMSGKISYIFDYTQSGKSVYTFTEVLKLIAYLHFTESPKLQELINTKICFVLYVILTDQLHMIEENVLYNINYIILDMDAEDFISFINSEISCSRCLAKYGSEKWTEDNAAEIYEDPTLGNRKNYLGCNINKLFISCIFYSKFKDFTRDSEEEEFKIFLVERNAVSLDILNYKLIDTNRHNDGIYLFYFKYRM